MLNFQQVLNFHRLMESNTKREWLGCQHFYLQYRSVIVFIMSFGTVNAPVMFHCMLTAVLGSYDLARACKNVVLSISYNAGSHRIHRGITQTPYRDRANTQAEEKLICF